MVHVWVCLKSSRILVANHFTGHRGHPTGGGGGRVCNPRGICMVHVWVCLKSSRILVVSHFTGHRGYPTGGGGCRVCNLRGNSDTDPISHRPPSNTNPLGHRPCQTPTPSNTDPLGHLPCQTPTPLPTPTPLGKRKPANREMTKGQVFEKTVCSKPRSAPKVISRGAWQITFWTDGSFSHRPGTTT